MKFSRQYIAMDNNDCLFLKEKASSPEDGELCNWKIAAVFTLAFLVPLYSWLKPTGPYLTVITSPAESSATAMMIIERADGAFVTSGRYPWIFTAYSTDQNFAAKLISAGALLVIDNRVPQTCLQEV